ncbi:MAG TPA: Gp37 family protein [Candidatus Gastranaerophilales bacterium]|nr:Gp37 family protein [Candidatus Gastranaerophilales bacterium]
MINDIENQIIQKIKENIPELHIEGFPEKPSEFRLTHSKGAILVHYQGGNYSESKSIGYIVQDKKLEFSVTVVTRNLRSHEGSYFYLDKVRNILTGYRPDNCSKMQSTKEEFISEDNGIWQYSINFSLTTPTIENYQEVI